MDKLKELLEAESRDDAAIIAYAKTLEFWKPAVEPTLRDPDVDTIKTLESIVGISPEVV